MLQELNKQDMQNIIGGQIIGVKTWPKTPGTQPFGGIIYTMYVDKDGNIVCGTPPSKPVTTRARS
jgi:bacteriocin-like protein